MHSVLTRPPAPAMKSGIRRCGGTSGAAQKALRCWICPATCRATATFLTYRIPVPGKTPERLLHGRFAKKTACPSPLCWKRNTAFLPIAGLRDSSKKSPCRKRWITGRSIRTSCATSLTVHSSWSMMNSTSNWLSEIRRRRAFSICSSAAADWRKNIGSSRKISRPSLNGTRRERSARWARRSAKSPRKY